MFTNLAKKIINMKPYTHLKFKKVKTNQFPYLFAVQVDQALFQTDLPEVWDFQIFIKIDTFSSNQLYFHNEWHKGLLTFNSWNKP